jgi:hypothetical protein
VNEKSSTFLHEEATTEQQGKTRKKMTIEKKTDVHASATDNNQHAKTETKKGIHQSEGPSYCEEDHEEHNHVQQVPDDVARRREMITYKKNMEVSGAGASSSSSLLEQTLLQRKPRGRRGRDRIFWGFSMSRRTALNG